MCSTVYENCHANSNLSEYCDSVRATARSRGSVSTSGTTVLTVNRMLVPSICFLVISEFSKIDRLRLVIHPV